MTSLEANAKFLDESKSLACVHCGLCLGACPTYLETGNENESPRGRIYIMRALQAGRLPVDDASGANGAVEIVVIKMSSRISEPFGSRIDRGT